MGTLITWAIIIWIVWLVTRKPKFGVKTDYGDAQFTHRKVKRKTQSGDECWVKKGSEVDIQGFHISGGMIYVGEHLYTSQSSEYYYQAEPCLINPNLKAIKSTESSNEYLLPYYPSYSDAPSQARANYLEWLSSGADDPSIQIGYVFIYFYGLERRFFVDKARLEWPLIIDEVFRLRKIFSNNSSFQHYANVFLSSAKVMLAIESGNKIYEEKPIEYFESWQTPLDIRIALGQMAKEKIAVGPEWALAWIYSDSLTSFRTPVKRAAKEFQELFTLKFNEAYPDGLLLKPNTHRISANYRAVSGSFDVSLNVRNLPDVSILETPKKNIRSIVDTCTTLLDPYSRFLGRNPKAIGKLESILLLPSELLNCNKHKSLEKIQKILLNPVTENGKCVVEAKEIINLWPTKDSLKISKKEALDLSKFLAMHKIGIIPDVAFGDAILKTSDKVMLFLVHSNNLEVSVAYKSAARFLELAMRVALADNHFSESEAQHLAERLENAFHLTKTERFRLECKMEYFVNNKGSIKRLAKNIVDQIPEEFRPEMALYLLSLAGADGIIDPSEVGVLTRIYNHLGFDKDKLFGDLNSFGAHWSSSPEDEPVTIKKADNIVRHSLPDQMKDAEAIVLNMDRVHQKVKDTEKVSKLLEDVFCETADEEHETIIEVEEKDNNAELEGEILNQLEKPYRALLQELITCERWGLEEFKKLAQSFDILPGGAVEVLNSWAYDNFDEPLIEEGDEFFVNQELYSEVMTNG